MEFGKVAQLDHILWNVPPEPISGLPPNPNPVALHIGTTGWGEKDWVGNLYPKGTKTADYLSKYSKVFDTIELNTTHYQIPDRAKISRWYHNSIYDFKFCPKLPRAISHHRNLGVGTDHIHLFCEAILGLEEKLGPCFIQLPPYFDPGYLSVLEKFFEEWPKEIVLHVEFRHENWFLSKMKESISSLLITHKKGIVMTDVAGRRDVLNIPATNEIVFIRFVGNLGHKTDRERIQKWIITLSGWANLGIKEVYFFLHQPEAKAILPMYHCIKNFQYDEKRLENNRKVDFLKAETTDYQLKLF